MSLIRHIKSKICTIEAYLRSNNAMKSVASVRTRKYKKKANVLLDAKFLEMTSSNIEKKQETIKTFHIVIGCNQGMCGAFFEKISYYTKNLLKKKNTEDLVYILGEKFLNYRVFSNVKVEKLEYTDAWFLKFSSAIFDCIVEEGFLMLKIHFSGRKGMKSIEIDVSSFRKKDHKEEDFYSMLRFLTTLSRAVFTSGFYENKERVISLEQAKMNAEKMQKKGYNELNRARQENITNDLAEIVAGVLI